MDALAAAERVRELLLEATRERVADVEEVAVAFSGGLDSSVIAVAANNCGVKVFLVSVSLKNQPETQFTERAAEALGLPLRLETYEFNDVEAAVSPVLQLIGEPDAMKLSVAIPFYWTAENASKLGYNVLLTGQLSDELFGGYHRYLREYGKHGPEAVREAMRRDAVSSYEMNLQAFSPVCARHGVELRLPFADREVVNYALSLPAGLNIASADDRLRKRVLRKTAQLLDLPEFIVNKPKKAVQYATGVDKALRKLAKNKGLTLQNYIEETFEAA